jgi:hypothetical protein
MSVFSNSEVQFKRGRDMKNQEIEIKIAYDEDWQEVAINKVKYQ